MRKAQISREELEIRLAEQICVINGPGLYLYINVVFLFNY